MKFAAQFVFSLVLISLCGILTMPFLVDLMRGTIDTQTDLQSIAVPVLAAFAGVGGFAFLASLFYTDPASSGNLYEETAGEIATELISTYQGYRKQTRRALSVAVASMAVGLIAIVTIIAANLGFFRWLNVEPNTNTTFLTCAAGIVTEFVALFGFGLFKMTSTRLQKVSDRLQLLLNLMAGVDKARENGDEDVARAMLIKYYKLGKPSDSKNGT